MKTERNLLSATTLIGDKVVNNKNEDLGKIQELMIDLDRGHIGYAVLSAGGILGIGNKLFAIPWGALKIDQQNKCFILSMSKEQLENAPGFDKDNWPDMSDSTWGTNIHEYYKSRPYWLNRE